MKLPILWEFEFWQQCWLALHSEEVIETLTDEEFFSSSDYIKEQLWKAEQAYVLVVMRKIISLRRHHVYA